MAFIVYNRMDPSLDNRKTNYIVVKDTEEEALVNFEDAIATLELGEGFYVVDVDYPRGKLTEEVIMAGIQSDWGNMPAEILYAVDNYYANSGDEDWEDD